MTNSTSFYDWKNESTYDNGGKWKHYGPLRVRIQYNIANVSCSRMFNVVFISLVVRFRPGLWIRFCNFVDVVFVDLNILAELDYEIRNENKTD